MILETRKQYEAYLSALSDPITSTGGELAEKMESIRKSLLDLPEATSVSDLQEAYRGKVPQIQNLLVKWYRAEKKTPLYTELPETPEGMDFLTEMAKASKCYNYSSVFEVLKHCIGQRDFALGKRFIEENAKEENRDYFYETLIKAQFNFDESTPSVPAEFKELFSRVQDDMVHDNILGDFAMPYGSQAVFLQNPTVLEELAAMYRDEATGQNLKEIAARMKQGEQIGWCPLW